ncbi:hypothetical protein A2U01_0082778, partial [Trifolium medium]|nr:hypothetical protein [Trifolium medium]
VARLDFHTAEVDVPPAGMILVC